MSCRIFDVVIALILLICAVSPFVESGLGCDNNIFLTGHDAESTLAVLMLLLELAFALASALVLLLLNIQVTERIVEKYPRLTSEPGFRNTIPDASPPLPLRI